MPATTIEAAVAAVAVVPDAVVAELAAMFRAEPIDVAAVVAGAVETGVAHLRA